MQPMMGGIPPNPMKKIHYGQVWNSPHMKNYRNLGPRNFVGPAIRRFRNDRGFSQEQLANKLQIKGWNTSRDVIASIEGQTRRVSDFELVLLATILRVTVQELLPKRDLTAKALEFAARLERALE